MVRVYCQVYYGVFSQYVEYEFDVVLCESCGVFIRVMKFNILVLNNLFVNIIGNQGYIELEQVVMQQVKVWFEQVVKGCNICLIDELVLFKIGLLVFILLYMEYDVVIMFGQ